MQKEMSCTFGLRVPAPSDHRHLKEQGPIVQRLLFLNRCGILTILGERLRDCFTQFPRHTGVR